MGMNWTGENHAWSAMARSNHHCRHLFAVVCPLPWSDTPRAVVSLARSSSVPEQGHAGSTQNPETTITPLPSTFLGPN